MRCAARAYVRPSLDESTRTDIVYYYMYTMHIKGYRTHIIIIHKRIQPREKRAIRPYDIRDTIATQICTYTYVRICKESRWGPVLLNLSSGRWRRWERDEDERTRRRTHPIKYRSLSILWTWTMLSHHLPESARHIVAQERMRSCVI